MPNINNTISDLFRSDLENALNGAFFTPVGTSRYPMLNISDSDKEISVELSVPGFTKSELEISVDKGLLSVRGKRESERENAKRRFLRKEFAVEEFSRTFRVDASADQDSITSSLEHGILTITIPKVKKTESRKLISIS